jgi:hemolysin III
MRRCICSACVALLFVGTWPPDAERGVALAAYAGGLIGMLTCSLLYNASTDPRRRQILRRFDHAAIFAMIAGTYTPVTLLAVGGLAGHAVLAVVWAGAIAGAALKLAAPARFERLSLFAYLALGWAGAMITPRLIEALPPGTVALLIAGGLLYTIGVAAHLWTRLRFHAVLWHGCVVAAAACHYVVVLRVMAA